MSDAETQTLVFGRCFGMLCLQRGRPALHACAVWLGGGAIAVAGASGAGKSTTARALMRRGHDLMTDDQLVLDPETCLAQACIPSNKLCLDAAEGLGEALDPTQRILRGAAKFHAPAPRFRPDPGPLRAVFLLAPRPDLARPEVRRLSPTQAIANLDPMIVRRDVAAAIGALPGVFAWLSRVAAAVPVYAIWRPDELAGLDRLVDQLVEIGAAHGATGGTRRRARGRQGGAPAT